MRNVAIVLTLVLLAASVPAIAAGPGKAAFARQASQASDNQFDSSPHKAAALEKAEQRGMFAKWERDQNRVHGRFAAFNLTGEAGVIADFAYRNGTGNAYRALFSEVEFQGFTRDPAAPNQGVRVTGSILRVLGEDGLLRMHNNPTAGIRFQNGDLARDVNFQLAQGVTAGDFTDNNKSLRLNLASFGHAGHAHLVVTNGTITKTSTFVKVALDKNATLAFMVHPNGANAERLHAKVAAIAKGRLGAAGDLVVVEGNALLQADDIDVALRPGNVSAKKVQFYANGQNVGARVVMLTLARADFPDLKNGSLNVTIGGAKAALVAASAVHTATAAAANVTIDKDLIFLSLNVPHFSEQEIVVQSVETTGSDGTGGGGGNGGGGIPGFAALAAFAALAFVAIGLRRRD